MKEHDVYDPKETELSASPGAEPAPHARRGERVGIWVDVIKADKREAWERLLHDLIAPAVRERDPELLRTTRLLEPAAANEDGTWTFVILPDPLDERSDYDATRYVREAFGEAKAAEADRIWDDCHARPQYEIDLLESAW